MNDFVHEDGQGNLFNDKGMAVAVVEMEVDEGMYPIETVTNFGMYQELKPPEKPEKNNEKKEDRGDVKLENNTTTRIYKSYKEVEKEQLFALVYEKGMSAREASLKLHITPRTAQRWIANDQQDPQTYTARKEGSGRPVGRPAIMDDRHKTHLVDLIDEEPALVLDQMMDSLTAEFIDLEISKTALYNFVTKECKISLKRAHFHSVERNCLEKITARKEWVEKWMATDMDYMSNCVFIDEATFHINMKRSIAWSKVGTRAVVKIPKTRAKTTTILGAACAFGVVNIK
ncbi:MAG: hypothetical protein EXX96DRAFT_448167, partial [Benjaminiella poitrasii]